MMSMMPNGDGDDGDGKEPCSGAFSLSKNPLLSPEEIDGYIQSASTSALHERCETSLPGFQGINVNEIVGVFL